MPLGLDAGAWIPLGFGLTRELFPAQSTLVTSTLEVTMAKQESIEVEGLVTEVLPDQNFRVKLQNDHVVLAYAAGKMSKFRIRVLVGDMVTVQLSPYDMNRGRITYRHKVGSPPPPNSNQQRRRR